MPNRTQAKPDGEDYLTLFARYEKRMGDIYLAPPDERFRFLFDQVCTLLTRPSPFNFSLPEAFRVTAHRYREGDAATRERMERAQNRHFMLSDLFDYIHLVQTMGAVPPREGPGGPP